MKTPIIDIKNANAFIQDNQVFNDLCFRVGQGEKVAILGPNGAGKSTLLKLITRSLYPVVREGSYIRLFGKEHFSLWDLRKQIGFVSEEFQSDYTPYTRGIDVVLSGYTGSIGQHDHLSTDEAQQQHAEDLIAEMGVTSLQDKMFQRMSTGQKRRFLLARAAVHNPDTLIFDEPSSGLDLAAAAQMLRLMRDHCHHNRSILLTTHHVEEIIPEIQRVVLISNGQIIADGNKADILTSENLSNLYGLEVKVREEDGWYSARATL